MEEKKMDDSTKRLILIVAVVIYVISPVDLMPGVPIDDIIVAVIGYNAQKKLNESSDINDMVDN